MAILKRDVAILDIGSKDVTIMVGERGVNGTFRVKGRGSADYAGFQNGQFLEPEQVKYAIGLAINNAETSGGIKITDLVVGVPGEFASVVCKEATLNFDKRKKINENDIKQLFYTGNVYKKHPTHTVVNQSPIYYSLDDGRRVIEPRGMSSSLLRGNISYVLAENNFLDFVDDVLRELGIRKVQYLSAQLAEMCYLFDPSVRDRYVLLVDCGYITTSVMLARGDGLLYLSSFSLGGGFITGDLSQVLKISFPEAESLKHRVVLSWDAKEGDVYEVQGADYISPYSALTTNKVVCSRLDMIASYIQKSLDMCNYEYPDYLPIYLTGGGLNYLRGIRDYLSRKLGRRIELINPTLPQISKPDFSSEIGLLDMALQNQDNDNFLFVR